MILVTLGTQDKQFIRLLYAVQKQIDNGNIKDKVVVQSGCTEFESNDMEIFDLIPKDDFEKLMSECDLLITHGGVSSILTGLKSGKKVIAAARLQKFGEHTNDHQLQIIDNFSANGYILSLENFDDLDKVLEKSKSFIPKQFKSNTANMVSLIENFIDNN